MGPIEQTIYGALKTILVKTIPLFTKDTKVLKALLGPN